jgi:hypothetical protein
MQPARHTYAALKLEQGEVEEAFRTYAEDLGLDGGVKRSFWHPKNVWALHGYYECLERLGRSEGGEGRMVKMELDLALAVADIEIESSCFCRLDVKGEDKQGEQMLRDLMGSMGKRKKGEIAVARGIGHLRHR